MGIYAPRQQTARIGSPARRMFKGGAGGVRSTPYVSKAFTITPAQVSATSVGYRFNPIAGAIAPDDSFAGGTVDRVLVLDDDTVQVFPAGLVEFPDMQGPVLMIARQGMPDEIRVSLEWDIDHYAAPSPGAYAAVVAQIGLGVPITLAGNKA